jgi:predicted HAD superfamily Cof-like phosphohydrolase
MTNFVEDIKDFHKKFGLEYKGPPRELPRDLYLFRVQFLSEELNEYCIALAEHNKANQLDALVDLLYVAFGTAHLHGFNIQEAWNRVHAVNMQKVKALKDEDSKRGSGAYDVVKPKGWKAPKLDDLV